MTDTDTAEYRVTVYPASGPRHYRSNTYPTLKRAELAAEGERARGLCSSVTLPCGHPYDRYRSSCRACHAPH